MRKLLYNVLAILGNANDQFNLVMDVAGKVGVVKGGIIFEKSRIGLGKDYRLIKALIVQFLDMLDVIPTDGKNSHRGLGLGVCRDEQKWPVFVF
jgi:hypothetical protein